MEDLCSDTKQVPFIEIHPQHLEFYIDHDGFWSRLSSQRRPVSTSVVCGLMLFALGLVSLFTGHAASDPEWYSQRLMIRSLFYKLILHLFSTSLSSSLYFLSFSDVVALPSISKLELKICCTCFSFLS
ncbi:O-fucosyltransferase 29 [Camellia lanceoleosa]|uniref:O-fucosyltransferase 29 n=1 Tax=Camellia lanceoleosa TaxID=1840588 RepID=A0ACC0GD14_9ERIC|nr:O-fucosyltransferase 29 [Camellia lanceoleosa]